MERFPDFAVRVADDSLGSYRLTRREGCGSPKSDPSTKSTGCQCVDKLLSDMNMGQVPPLAGSDLALALFP